MGEAATADVDTTLGGTVAHAWEAHHAADWDAAYVRWERVRELFPDYAPPYIHGGISLWEAGRREEALSKLRHGVALFPDNAQLVTTLGSCLDRIGHLDQRNALFEASIPGFPDNPEVAIDYIRLTHQRQDHATLLRGAALMERTHPGRIDADAGVRHMVSNARLQFEMSRMDQPTPREATPTGAPGSSADAELMLAFQSLGENCEFGLTQRHFGVEPLGLLRWAAISVYSLTQALNESFEGVGTRERTKFVEGGNEYATAHTRYGMGSHTFVKVDKENEEAVFGKLLARLSYLRRKLIEDLEEGDQTFVYSCEEGTTERELSELHQAVCRYGSRYLLFVCRSDDDHPPGTLTHAGDGLMVGYIDRLGPDRLPEGDVWNISYHYWKPLLRAALDMRRQDEAERALAAEQPPPSRAPPPSLPPAFPAPGQSAAVPAPGQSAAVPAPGQSAAVPAHMAAPSRLRRWLQRLGA